MSSHEVAAIPCSTWSAQVASTIRRLVCMTAEDLRDMSYFRGDISLTKLLRVIIVAGAVLPKIPRPAPQGGTYVGSGVHRRPVPHRPRPAALVLRHARRGQGLGGRYRRAVHAP